ncbi:MAG: hypothetical protein VXY27_01725 [Thermoproteota archaeon]|nr:hypothetical protein [Thermoproteota archaeon]MEC8529600.1 hypothetical protein [Thermoproteota archaeon]
MRKITVKITEKDYLDFLLESNEHENTVEEQITEIIQYYVLIRRRRVKLKLISKETLDSHM